MKNKCVCISGSTFGIGYGIAEAFAKRGAKIVINSNEDDNGAQKKISELTECYFVKEDLSTVEGSKKWVKNVPTLFKNWLNKYYKNINNNVYSNWLNTYNTWSNDYINNTDNLF